MTFYIICLLVKSTQNIWVILQNRTGRFVHSVMNSSSGGQRVGKEVVVCWQAHTGMDVSETMPQKQINKNIPRSLPLLHSDSKTPVIITRV